jgi:serine/threonine-protein kinase HipA
MNGAHVGTWSQPRSSLPTFQYDEAWIGSPEACALSLSLPLTPPDAPHRGSAVADYFDNLLPDSEAIRHRLRSKFSVDSSTAFALLTAIGRDCVGALQLLPEGESPKGFDRIEAELLDESGVERAIAGALSGERLLGHAEEDNFRISIAGAQEKTALLFYRNRWCRPHGMTPTTHILKLPLGLVGNLQANMTDSVENEWLCSRLLEAFGLPVAHCEMAQFGSRKVLVVERFDRSWQANRWIQRLPQEDFCQALGIPMSQKYESEGGPGMRDILRVLETGSMAAQDKRSFIKAQMMFWLLAATDGHAKNFSLFHGRGGTYRLTPFYDVLSAWPIIGHGPGQIAWQKAKLAMALRATNVHWKLSEIQASHWHGLCKLAGLGDATELIQEMIEQSPSAIESVNRQIPAGFPAYLRDKVFAGIQQQVSRLAGTG